MKTAPPCSGPVNRRDFLRIGALALGGLTLPQILAGRARAATGGTDTSVILLYLHGGPSQLETYDLKPDAPLEYRSVFRPIRTNVAGMDICEHMPLQARIADKFAVIRSVHHTMSSHTDGGIEVLTGKTPARPDPASRSMSEHPDIGAVASRVRGLHPRALPRYVAIPNKLYMVRPSYLGLQHGPFNAGDPHAAGYRMPGLDLPAGIDGRRFDERRTLRQGFDDLRREMDVQGQLAASDQFRSAAMQMLTNPQTAAAFDLERESGRLRDRYGRHRWGQACLLARRLAEAGVAVTTIYIDSPADGMEFSNWDDHIGNNGRPGHFAVYFRRRLLYFDQALSALIEDVYARGLDRKIMILALGEFGRTPRLSHNNQGTGRDHWPNAMSVLISGGGLRMGQVVGATNPKAEFPTQRPCTPKDVLATAYRHLGIDTQHAFVDHTGRPIAILGDGQPIVELG
jgi:uncharacterized protein (DUF1501 family)